jgi:hypothetical protein
LKHTDIKETDGILKKIGLAIPQTTENFKEYMKTMKINEEELRQNLMTDKTPNPQQSVNAIRVSEVCEGQKSALTFRVT